MSEYTREEILKMIEEAGGPENLDLSGKDLSGIDLSKESIAKESEKYRKSNPDQTPLWFSQDTGRVNLNGATLKEANLNRAKLREAVLSGANLQGAILFEAELQEAILDNANLQDTTLSYANLQEAILAGVNLQNASLFGANLQEACLFYAHLEKVDVSIQTRLARAHFYGAFLDHTRMTRGQLGGLIGEEVDRKYYSAKEAYLLLKNNFNQIGRYDDASWAYVKEQQMEKMTYHPKLARDYYFDIEGLPQTASWRSWSWWRFYVKYTLKWAWDWIIEWLCGYGERPQNVVAVALGVLTIFPFLYLLTGLALGSGQNLLWRDYFLYSLYSFASMEHPTLQAMCWIAQLFTGIESLFGIALLALLMYTLGRRISRS